MIDESYRRNGENIAIRMNIPPLQFPTKDLSHVLVLEIPHRFRNYLSRRIIQMPISLLDKSSMILCRLLHSERKFKMFDPGRLYCVQKIFIQTVLFTIFWRHSRKVLSFPGNVCRHLLKIIYEYDIQILKNLLTIPSFFVFEILNLQCPINSLLISLQI